MNDINHNDPQALAHRLRDARRHNDLEGVLDACERLLAQGEHVPRVRDALRWSVDKLRADEREAYTYSGDVFMALLRGLLRPARRIANLARLLPNPQPMERPPSQYKLYDGTDAIHHPLKPAPTHALRIYADALMIAKGEGWARWMTSDARGDAKWWAYSSTSLADNKLWLGPDAVGKRDSSRIYRDGSIECGETMPPVPEMA